MSEHQGGIGGGDHDEEGHDEEPWLVSYADMMTLLFGFFVLMYAFAMAKLEKVPDFDENMIHVRKELTKYFGGEYVTPLQEASTEFKKKLEEANIAQGLEITERPEGLDIIIQSQGMFASGSATLSPSISEALVFLADRIKKEPRPYEIVVEGHTDDVPIGRAKARYPTNWELSAARASAVVRLFAAEGIPQERLVAVGYGSSRPKVPNRAEDGTPIEANRAKNRRIRLKVIALPSS